MMSSPRALSAGPSTLQDLQHLQAILQDLQHLQTILHDLQEMQSAQTASTCEMNVLRACVSLLTGRLRHAARCPVLTDVFYLVEKMLTRSLLYPYGKIKDINALSNLYVILADEGFDNITLSYLGGFWVLIDAGSVTFKEKMINHVGVASWFSELCPTNNSFVGEDRLVWISVEGLPMIMWNNKALAKIVSQWGTLSDVEDVVDTSLPFKKCMHTRSSSNLPVESSPNPTTSNPRHCNRIRSKQPFILEESPVDVMADQRTMAELLRAPTEGYTEAIVVLPILAEKFELKHSLINMMTSDQFFGLEKDNPHDHIRWFNKITSTIKYKDVPNSAIKLMLFPFSLAGAARRWLKKNPRVLFSLGRILFPNSLMNSFPPSRTTNLRNEISNFQQRFDESIHQALDRYKDLLRACLHHGFTELHQLDTFYNALNPPDQDSLNSAADVNLLERRTQDVLTIIENKSKCCDYRHDTYSQTTPPPASVKAVEEICVTCGGAHPYYQCLAAGGNTFLELRDNIQGYVSAAAVNYNQGYNRGNNFNQDQSYQALTPENQVVPLSELEKIKRMNEANMKGMQTQINNMKNDFFQMNTASTSGSGHLPSNTVANPKGELKAITTRSGIVLDGTSILIPSSFINPKEDERVEETLTDQDLAEYTIKVPLPLVQKPKPHSQRKFVVHQRDPLYPNIPYPSRMLKQKQQEKYEKMLKALLSNKEKLLKQANTPLNKNCLAVILKKLREKLEDPWKFLIPCGFSELKCKVLADLAGIVRDVFIPVDKFTFPADFVIVDYESDPRVPLILGRPFLRTARALIDVHGEEMIQRDDDEKLTLNMRHDTSSYSNQPQKELINMINIFDDSSEDFLEDLFATNHQSGNPTFSSHLELTSPEVKDDVLDLEGGNVLIEKLLDLDSIKDLHPSHNVNPPSSSTTSSSSPNHSLEEFADELALLTFPSGNDDLPFGIEYDLREIEYLLNNDPIKEMDSILEDSVDEDNLADLYDNLANTMPEMFIDEHAIDYSSPQEKIKESKLLIDELDLPRSSNFLPSSEYDSFLSQDYSEVDAFPSTNNKDKVFNLGGFWVLTDAGSVTFKEKLINHVVEGLPMIMWNNKALAKIISQWGTLSDVEDVVDASLPFKKVKENQEKDKIESKPDKNGKRGEAGKSQKQLQ
nr:hypothetical protein [Tanacetum cinerariifolium]